METFSHRYQCNDFSFRCTLDFCQRECVNFQELMAHLRQHIDSGLKVNCPFKDCGRQFHIKSSFSSHVSRYHRNYNIQNVDAQYVINQANESQCLEEETSSLSSVMNGSMSGPDIVSDDEDINTKTPVAEFTKSVALFLLKLQSKNLIPESTIQEIVEELYLLNQMTCENFEKCLKTKLDALNILSKEEINRLVLEIISDEMSMLWCSLAPSPLTPNIQSPDLGVLRSSYTRKLYFTREFNVISPVAIPLVESVSGKMQFCHYVPILESLKCFCENSSVNRNINHTYHFRGEDGLYSDIQNGHVFQQNDFFKKFPTALQIILFQDSFEVVNPLGSSRTKHKVLAVYYTIGNLDPRCRSIIDPIQLVLLCKEKLIKQAGQEMVFSKLLTDLKCLEETGIILDTGELLKGTVVSITGDNLGSHYIGGFCESFNAEYFCRYCSLSKSEICEGKHYIEGPYRTKETHMRTIQLLEESENDHIDGVKFNSVFNSLSHFHVAAPGLPPCLGHDLFEGLVDYDLALFIDYFVKQKWFTYDLLNENLNKFPFHGPDAANMLKAISKGKKIGGQAVQNWWFLRFFPLVAFKNVKDADDAVWQLCIKLKDIVEIVVSPCLHESQIAYLKVLVEEYLEERTDLFPNCSLRPKHHFLSHYHWLITMFGPLIRLWTLRFESKHSFFKRCARYSQNFINITSTLAQKHQLLQAFCSNGQLFPEQIQLLKEMPFHVDLYSLQIRQAIFESQMAETEGCSVSDEVLMFGTKYKKGMFLLLAGDNGTIKFASLLLVLLSQGCVYFVVRNHSHHYLSDYGIYEIDTSLNESVVTCVPFKIILDHYPLLGYRVNGVTMVTLKHKPALQI
ncbi:uncharacterized protein [Apostichopus japonicus]|uniref:uncharacterized protein n=1 Tax=Stichopus japonicus TaxID=307972 RepID=UPI003AB268A6